MSNCNTKNCCFHGIDLVVKCYDPQPEFKDFTVPTFWFNRCNGKLFLLKEIDADGKAVWIDITSGGSGGSGIEQILTECGLVQPDSEGQIKVKGSCGIRALAEGCEEMCVDILTGFGLKGGGRVCNGESLTIEVDTDFAGDVTSPDPANVGDVPMYKDTTGKVITPSNINSVDGLTKITKSTAGEQLLRVETLDTGASSNAGIIAKSTGSAFPYFELTKDEFSWRNRLDSSNGNYQIRPTGKDPILSMLPNGVIRSPYQPTAAAYLLTTPTFPKDTNFEVGSNLAFVKILDTDGYNLNANNLFVGDGNGKGLTYTSQYDNAKYMVGFQFNLDTNRAADRVLYSVELYYGEKSLVYDFSIVQPDTYRSISACVVLPLNKGEKFFFVVSSNTDNSFISARRPVPHYSNYVGITMLG